MKYSNSARAACESCISARGAAARECHSDQFLRDNSAIGVVRTGAALMLFDGVSRAHNARPDRHRLSNQWGS
ncbi:hypothetical protein D3C83_200790 [compost metagenome]